jgi:hypothetical protein
VLRRWLLRLTAAGSYAGAVPPAVTAVLAGGSLVAGFAVADVTGVRPLGGVVLLLAGLVCAWQWRLAAGLPTAAGLVLLYAGAFAAAHPLARTVGAWPSVLLVAVVVGTASLGLAGRRSRAVSGRAVPPGAPTA